MTEDQLNVMVCVYCAKRMDGPHPYCERAHRRGEVAGATAEREACLEIANRAVDYWLGQPGGTDDIVRKIRARGDAPFLCSQDEGGDGGQGLMRLEREAGAKAERERVLASIALRPAAPMYELRCLLGASEHLGGGENCDEPCLHCGAQTQK